MTTLEWVLSGGFLCSVWYIILSERRSSRVVLGLKQKIKQLEFQLREAINSK